MIAVHKVWSSIKLIIPILHHPLIFDQDPTHIFSTHFALALDLCLGSFRTIYIAGYFYLFFFFAVITPRSHFFIYFYQLNLDLRLIRMKMGENRFFQGIFVIYLDSLPFYNPSSSSILYSGTAVLCELSISQQYLFA